MVERGSRVVVIDIGLLRVCEKKEGDQKRIAQCRSRRVMEVTAASGCCEIAAGLSSCCIEERDSVVLMYVAVDSMFFL